MNRKYQKVMVNQEDGLLKSSGFIVYGQALKKVLAVDEKSQDLTES